MKNYEIEKSKTYTIRNVVDYAARGVSRTVLVSKLTGCIHVNALNRNEVIDETPIAFDTFIFILEGKAGVTIDKIVSIVKAGQGIIIPAHRSNSIKALQRFKMLIAIIKSGYETV